LPETINGILDLNGLTSAVGLKLPETINGKVSLRKLPEEDKIKLSKKYPDMKIVFN
jgi:hypothetical protein